MVEVEMKFRVEDFASLERGLESWHVRDQGRPQREIDQYFNAPDRDFAQTDEALRIRRVVPSNFVTYKGPKRDPQTKTRTEIEVRLADGLEPAEQFTRLLTELGYRPVAAVHKTRRTLHIDRSGFGLNLSFDQVENLGRFVELEIQVPENQLEEARAVLMETAREMGLANSERRSYLELLLAK